jgi:hypothetical protein
VESFVLEVRVEDGAKEKSQGELGGGKVSMTLAYLDIFFDLNGTHGVGRVI